MTMMPMVFCVFFFSSRRRHTRLVSDWSSDVCSSDLNCGRNGDLESLCSLTAIERNLLPYFLPRYPGHELAKLDPHQAAKLVRGLADKGDALGREIFRVQEIGRASCRERVRGTDGGGS